MAVWGIGVKPARPLAGSVTVDWLNILFAVSTRHTIDAQFAKDTCTINPNYLRIDWRFKEFSDWDHVERTCVSKHAQYQSRIELTELRITAQHGTAR